MCLGVVVQTVTIALRRLWHKGCLSPRLVWAASGSVSENKTQNWIRGGMGNTPITLGRSRRILMCGEPGLRGKTLYFSKF